MQSCSGKQSKSNGASKSDERPSLSSQKRDYKRRHNTSSVFSDSSGESSGSEGPAADEYVFFEMNLPSKALLSAANLFGVHSLRSACCRYLTRHMDCTNALGVLCFAETHSCARMAATARVFVLKNFREVSEQEEFLSLTPAKLREIISSDHLVAESEEIVFRAVLRWLDHDPQERSKGFHKNIFPKILGGLESLRNEGHFCDVSLSADGQLYPAHKSVLSAFSPYFKAMFTGRMAESRQQVVTLQGLDGPTLATLIDYAYTSVANINSSNAQILEVVRLNLLSPYFLHDYLELVQSNGSSPRDEEEPIEEEKSGKTPTKEGSESPEKASGEGTSTAPVSPKPKEGGEVSKVPKDEKEKLGEAKAVTTQSSGNGLASNSNAGTNLQPIRKSSMSSKKGDAQYCVGCKGHKQKVSCAPSISPPPIQPPMFNKECIQLLKEACIHHLLPDRRAEISNPERSRLRACSGVCQVVLAVGGEDDKVVLRTVECFSPSSGEWRALDCLPFAISKHGLVTSCSSNWAYLCGGEFPDGRPSPQVWRYDPFLANAWTEVAPMNAPRSELGLAMLDGSIFAVGGWDGSFGLDSVERYDPSRNQWFPVAAMPHPLASPAVVAHHGLLYVIGGSIHQEGDGIDLVQRYDPRCDTWHNQGSLLIPRSGAAACAIGHHIYVMGGWHASTENTNKVECYDVRNNFWEYRAPMQEKRYRPGATVVEGDIYVLGGEGGWNMYLETIEKYSPGRDIWVPAGEMPTARSWLSCITLQVPR
ncbi:hypothetical protein J437_LFUL012690 [Ladona fulva]|uniref:BTB domain-containing protein n=1 Tax=Ladona fulva TaxID=123851 RepID=A0A8K0NUM0_LADFU|nr:hypothetical protein J437_LFUL012690 [Ladona fulva]